MLIAFAVLVVAVGGVSLSFVGALDVQRSSQERQRALDAAESVLESMKAAPYAEVFARYNADPLDDPIANAPGASFAVLGLAPAVGDPDGQPGEIEFPTNAAGELVETVNDAFLGMPRDLDGSGAPDAGDKSGVYRLLPVAIRVRWQGVSGVREVSLVTNLSDV